MVDDVKTDDVGSVSKSVGCCKWFNNKQGFGFITVTRGQHTGEDVFVHHSGINVSEEQYRYLVQGEYVEFMLTETESGEHKWYASEISGVSGGKLMCETRNLVRKERTKHNDESVRSGNKSDTRPRGRGPREIHVQDEEGTKWNLVKVNSRRGQGGKGGKGGKGGRQGSQGDKETEY